MSLQRSFSAPSDLEREAALNVLKEREKSLDTRENAIRAKERVLAAKQATVEAQLKR